MAQQGSRRDGGQYPKREVGKQFFHREVFRKIGCGNTDNEAVGLVAFKEREKPIHFKKRIQLGQPDFNELCPRHPRYTTHENSYYRSHRTGG